MVDSTSIERGRTTNNTMNFITLHDKKKPLTKYFGEKKLSKVWAVLTSNTSDKRNFLTFFSLFSTWWHLYRFLYKNNERCISTMKLSKMKMKLTWFCCGSFLLRNILSIFLNIHFLKPSFHSRPFYKVLSTNSPRYTSFPFSILIPFCILTFVSIYKKWFSHTSLFHVLDL